MAVRVVVEADWFTINGQRYIKQLAYCVVGNGSHGCLSFTFPAWMKTYRRDLERQARFSHGLNWADPGTYNYTQMHQAVNDIISEIGEPLTSVTFFAKGSEKCRLLEPFIGPVLNLEDLECPKYSDLICIPQTTLNKALAFALWLDTDF
jgi:hypothetical protein